MAHKLVLRQPCSGMAYIWNISEHVGDNASCPNRPTDVNLVKILIVEAIRARQPAWLHPSLRNGIRVNGEMDETTAYWIRYFNSDHRPRLSQSEEGIISPARGAFFSSNDAWTIVKLNYMVKQTPRPTWANLPHYPQALPALAAELQYV